MEALKLFNSSKVESIKILYQQYEYIKNQERELKNQKNKVKTQLSKLIRPNTSKEGIKHTRYPKQTVAYKKAIENIMPLVPKTKHPQVKKIIENHTTEVTIDIFKAEKQ